MRDTGSRRGRPPTGTEAVHLRFAQDIIEAIDAYRDDNMMGSNRQDVVRSLLRDRLTWLGYLSAID